MKSYHISNKMKSALSALLAVPAALLFTGCSDFLELEPRNEIVLESFWTEKADVDNIVSGCYSGLQSSACIQRMIIWGEGRSENLYVGLNTNQNSDLLNLLNENITAMNGFTTWVDFYKVINRCNTVIKYAPGVAANDPGYTDSELNATIAEMVGLRSLCYFYLIRTFRDVPYSTVAYTDDDQKMDLPATPFNQVLDSLITDLESVRDMAVKRYPSTKPLYQSGRITQDAINAMLCEMYLWKQDYDRCIQYADLVIESKKLLAEENLRSGTSTGRGGGTGGRGSSVSEYYSRTNGYPLTQANVSQGSYGNTFTTLFARDDYTATANQEIIFQLVFSDDPRANSMIANGAVNSFYGNSNATRGLMAPSDYIIEETGKEQSREVYEDKNKWMDARMYENCNKSSQCVAKFVYRGVDINASTTQPTVTYTSAWPQDQVGSNWIIYRLSDIMLMKAEALTQKMRDGVEQDALDFNRPLLAQAFSLVNAVNKRSICQPTTSLTDTLSAGDYQTKVQMEDLVLRERERELMFEGKRWYDLVRLSRRVGNTTTLTAAAMKKAGTGASLIQNKLSKMDAIYLPYNNDEIKVNHNLVQNPAFQSGENSSYE